MIYTQILYDVADGVATITLNRPDKLNAFTGTMGDEVYHAFRQSMDDPAVKALVVTGAGTAFCSGVDVGALADPVEAGKIAATPLLSRFPLENAQSSKPTICALNGVAIGVGITMSLSFDIRIAALDAKLAVPFVKLGILPGLGSTYLLQRLVGRGRSLDLLLSGRALSGQEAVEIGLVERAVPAGEVLVAAQTLARELASRDAFVVGSVKAAVNFAGEADLAEAIDNEQRLIGALRAAMASRRK